MPVKTDVVTAPYDFADYITSADDVRKTIAVAFEDGDPAVITKMLGAAARSKGMAALAEETGLSRESLYKSLAETGNPEFKTVWKVVRAFGLQITVKDTSGSAARSDQAKPASSRRRKHTAA